MIKICKNCEGIFDGQKITRSFRGKKIKIIKNSGRTVKSTIKDLCMYCYKLKTKKIMLNYVKENVDLINNSLKKQNLVENLTGEQEEKLVNAHCENYLGSDDNLEDDFEIWLEELDSEDIIKIIK